ncbi:G5 domain-containing protein [Neobacillus sp. MM2021_6]|uniref:G5 domain-containing protein n=1 Tax=Bacillaceae TaxID=186817 RepID=UPI0014088142|nr:MULTISPECIES: G5 domain-containing protein [Bacillaceae]MBO0960708.1 G5 domain-containing protein [Neobacillus sp. MM2021_6]NHC17370.1 hypothetical protein [Bacillus sp. MM2020_4]
MRNPQGIKLFMALIVCTGFIFSFSHFGANAFEQVYSNKKQVEENKKISPVDQSGLKEQQEMNQTIAVISESSISINENNPELTNWVKQFPSLEIGPQSSFSLVGLLDDNSLQSYSNRTLSKIATAIYKSIIPTNFYITERHISRELPDYAELGFEANVNSNNNMDFVVTNPNDHKYTINFKLIDQLLYVSINGPKLQYSYKIIQNDKESFQPKTIIHYDAKLPSNSEKVETKGKEGSVIKVYREKIDKNGVTLSKELLSEDFYPPINQVILHSLLSSGTSGTSQNENNSSDSTVDKSNSEGTVDGTKQSENPDDTGENSSTTSDLWGKPNEVPK